MWGFTIREELISDLVLLAAGAVVTVILVPYFTNKWQLHQKGLEIKVDLIQRISNNVMGIMTLIESLSEPEDVESLELDKKMRIFKVRNKAIGTELEGYYPAEEKYKAEEKEPAVNVRDAWDQLRKNILDYYNDCYDYITEKRSLEENKKNKKRIDDIVQIHQEEDCIEVMRRKEHYDDKVVKLQKEHCKIIQKKHRIIWVILEGPMPGFSLLPWFIARSRWYKKWALRHYLCRIEKPSVAKPS